MGLQGILFYFILHVRPALPLLRNK